MGEPLRLVQARYEAGFPSDYNATPPVAQSADAEIYQAGERLRDWARYLAKNSSIVKAVLDARVSKGVGEGLRYIPIVKGRDGKLLKKLNSSISRVMDDWAVSGDVTGELSRAEIERVVWRDWDTAGEIFARKVHRGRTRERIGYQLQLIKSELVPYGFIGSGTTATMGIERDEWGAPQTVWVYPYQPSSFAPNFRVPSLVPSPISAENILHLRRQEEPDATRGVTLFHAVIFRASDIAEFQQSHRRAARASVNLFASINRSLDYSPDMTTTAAEEPVALADLQILDYLKQGESLNFHDPQHPNQNAIDFVNQELRQFAAACRVAFSWIAYVFDRAYSAQRTEHIHAWELIAEDRGQFIRGFAYPGLYVEPLRLAILEKRLPARELRRADPATIYDCRIDGPAMPSIDPMKDRQSAQLDQENGWDSRYGIIRRFGHVPDQVDAERKQDDFEPHPVPASPGERDRDENDEDRDE